MVDGLAAPLRVLLVDDCAISRGMFALGLSHSGVEVLEADDVEGALALARSRAPDAVVVDMFLGRESGLDVVRALRADPDSGPRAIVALSGHAGQEYRESAAKAGCAAYIVKPCDADRLLGVIRSVLRGEKPGRQVSNL